MTEEIKKHTRENETSEKGQVPLRSTPHVIVIGMGLGKVFAPMAFPVGPDPVCGLMSSACELIAASSRSGSCAQPNQWVFLGMACLWGLIRSSNEGCAS